MNMKSLQSAAHAAGYVMAPSEEQFHAPDGVTSRSYSIRDLSMRELALRNNMPALPSPAQGSLSTTWVKELIVSVLPRRATA